MATLSEKAKKIGLDKDVVELKFTNFKQESEDYFCGQDNCYIEGAFNELKKPSEQDSCQMGMAKVRKP